MDGKKVIVCIVTVTLVFLRIVYSDVQFGHPRYTIRTGSLKHPFLKSTFRQPQKISSGRTAHHHEFLFPRLKSKSTWSQATFNLFNLGKTFLLTHYFGGKSFKSLKNSSVTETANQTESYLDQKASVHSDDGNSRFKREISQQNPSIFYQNSSVLTPNMLIHSINSSQFPPSSSQNQSNIWDFESIQPFLPSSKDKDNFLSAIKTGSLKSTPNSLTAFEEISHYKTNWTSEFGVGPSFTNFPLSNTTMPFLDNGTTLAARKKCPPEEIFCLEKLDCIVNYIKAYDSDVVSWYDELDEINEEVICDQNGHCHGFGCEDQRVKRQFCAFDEIFCLITGTCLKCLLSEDEYKSEFPEFPHTTEPPVGHVDVFSDMCPLGKSSYSFPVTVYCRTDDDCPWNATCCYLSKKDKDKLPYCIWIMQDEVCPAIMHYCHATAKCQLLSQPCNYTCPNTWKYCPDLNLCIQEGSCSDGNSSDSKKHNNPFDIPTDILPVLKITPLYPILEDEELVFQVADVFSIEGVSDFSMNLKNKLLLRFMQEHLQWELHYVDYYNWIVNFSAFLSVKGLALEIVSIEIANETYIDPAIPFACLSGLSIEILEKNENVSKGSYCGNSGIRFKLRHVAKLTFLPNYSGHVIIRLAPIVIDLNGQHFYGEDQDLTIVINPINDSPSLRWGVANVDVDIPYISSLPISLISESDHGILVKDITDAYFQDADNDDLGMAVISAQFSDLGYWQFHLPNGSWENFTDIDVACALFKELGIPDTHQGAVLMDGLNQNEFLEVKYRTRRSIVFSDDTVNATSLFKLEVDHPLKDVSQLQFQRFYSNDYRELSDFIPYTDDRYVQNETEAIEGYHLTNFVGDVELKVPWRDRHRNPHPITNCSSQDDVELRNNDTPPNEESANRTSNDAVLNSDFPVTTRTSQNQIVPSINSTFQYQMPNLMNSTFQTNSETLNSTFFNFQPYSMNSTFPFQFPTSNNSSYQNQMATPRNSSPQTQTLTSETSSSETQMPISETWPSVTQIPTLESSSSPINMPHSATPSSQTQIPTLQVTSHFQMPTLINSSLQYQSSGNYGESLTSNLSHWAPELNTSGISDHVSKYPFFTSSTINPFDEMDNNNIIVKYFINFQIKAVFLPSNARLRFVRHNSTVSWWSILMAMSGSKLAFVAWDGSESMEHGKSQNVSFQLCTLQNEDCASNGSLAKHIVIIRQRPLDCFPQQSNIFPRKMDDCGVCGGNGNSCKDCHGVINGDGVMDCSVCVKGRSLNQLNSGRDCAMQCNKQNNFTENAVCISNNIEPNFSRCLSNTSVVDYCGLCRENSSDLDSDFIDSASEALCGRCSNLPESDKLMNHYKYFDCHQIWKQDQMAEVIAFGKHPYLHWKKNAYFGQALYIDLASYSESTLPLHLYGPSWSYKKTVYKNITCDLLNVAGQRVSQLECALHEDRLQVDFIQADLGDYRMQCKVMLAANSYHMLAPFPKINVVDSREIWIESCTPSIIKARESTTITLKGSGFVDSPELVCYYVRHPSRIARRLSSAKFIDSTQALCDISNETFAESMTVDIGIVILSLTFQEFNRGHFDLLSTTLDIHGDPPHLLKATLSADLYFLILEFSCNIDFQSCTDLFEDMTLFDSPFYCEAKGNTLIVNVTISKVLTSVNTPLVMSKVNTVSCLLSPKTIGAVGEVTLDLPLQYIDISFDLVAPSHICEDTIQFSISSINGNGLMPVETKWNISVYGEEVDGLNSFHTLSNFLENLSRSALEVELWPGLIMPNVKYSLEVTVFGLFHRKASRMINFIYLPTNVAVVNIRGPKRIHPRSDVYLTAVVNICPLYSRTKRPRYQFYWEIDGSKLDLSAIRGPLLTLKRGSLDGGRKYVVRCLVIINGDVNQTSVGEFVLSTLIGNPVAVTTVSRLTVPAHQGFQLRGENSHDPYGSYRDLMFLWSCFTPTGEGCYSFRPGYTQRLEVILNQTLRNPVLEVDGRLLSVGEYIFELTVSTADGREASARVDVIITPMKYAPQLFVSQGNNFEVNPGTEIGLRVFVTAPAGTELMWESVHEKGYQYFDVSSSSSTGWFYVLDSDAILVPISTVIRSADEKCDSWNCLMPSSSYKLRLTAKHPLEGATYADVVIETLPSPKLRKIRVTPHSGTAILSAFAVDISPVLSNDDTGTVIHIGYSDDSQTVDTCHYLRHVHRPYFEISDFRLPAVAMPSGKLYIVAKVCNSDSVCSSAISEAVEVVAPSFKSNQQFDAVLETIVTHIDEGDMSVALAHATSCIKTLKNAVRTIEAPLQRITSLAENLINIQVARTTLWIDGSRVFPEEAFDILNLACEALQEIPRPSNLTTTSLMFLHSKIMDTLVRWNLEKGHDDDDDDSDMYLTGFTNVSDWDADFSQLESQQSFNDSVAPHVRTKRRSRRKKNGSHFNVGSGISINSNTKHSSLKKESNLATNNKLQHSESSNIPSLKPTSRKNSFKKQRLPHQHHRVGNNSDTSYSFSWATFASKWKTAVQSHSHSLRQGDDGSRKPFSTSTFPGINDSFPNDATVPLDSTIERSPITFRQAEILLRATDLMLNMTSTSRGAIYQQLLSDLPGFWNAMCSGAIPNGKPVIVTSKTAVLQVVKLDMDTILSSTESISFGTKDSSNSNGHYFQFLPEVQDLKNQVDCSGTEVDCGIVCLGSAVMKGDPLTPALNSKTTSTGLKRGDTLALWPVLLSGGLMQSIMNFLPRVRLLFVISNLHLSASEIPYLKCSVWKINIWMSAVCNTTNIFTNSVAVKVHCTCPSDGFFGLYLDRTQTPTEISVELTTVPFSTTIKSSIHSTTSTFSANTSMTTQHATRSGTLNNYFYKFEFVIEGNYDSIVLNMTNFITIMTTQLADLLRISVSSFGQVFVYRGSVRVIMEVTPDSNSDYKSGHELMDHIQQLIEEDKFCFLGEKNETLCAKSDSYNLAKINDEQETKYLTVVIVGATFGIILGIIALCILRKMCKKKHVNKVESVDDNEIAGDDAYKYLEEAPPISILDGTIDSRKNFRMKIDGDPNAVPYDVERTTNLTQNLLPVVLNRPGTDSGLTPLDNPTMPSSVSSQMVQGEEGPLPISRSQRP